MPENDSASLLFFFAFPVLTEVLGTQPFGAHTTQCIVLAGHSVKREKVISSFIL